MTRAPRIAIIGGGVGGLAAALALEQRGAEIVICEQSPTTSEIGAGLNLSPNALMALRVLGVEDEAPIPRDGKVKVDAKARESIGESVKMAWRGHDHANAAGLGQHRLGMCHEVRQGFRDVGGEKARTSSSCAEIPCIP